VANAAISEAAERLDELMAQIDFWRDIAEECATIGTKVEACHRFEAALKVSPTQCLREIQAEAGRAGFVAGYNSGFADRGLNRSFSPEWHASHYAHDIRKGTKP
jgi:hypothetical protein